MSVYPMAMAFTSSGVHQVPRRVRCSYESRQQCDFSKRGLGISSTHAWQSGNVSLPLCL